MVVTCQERPPLPTEDSGKVKSVTRPGLGGDRLLGFGDQTLRFGLQAFTAAGSGSGSGFGSGSGCGTGCGAGAGSGSAQSWRAAGSGVEAAICRSMSCSFVFSSGERQSVGSCPRSCSSSGCSCTCAGSGWRAISPSLPASATAGSASGPGSARVDSVVSPP